MKMNKQLLGFLFLFLCVFCSCTEEEDYTQGVWIRKSDLNGVARAQACSFTIGNYGYICCGTTGKTTLQKDVWKYNIEDNYWTQCASLPDGAAARIDAAGFALNGKGYITTGAIRDDPYYLADTWEYDPTADSWMQKDDFAGGKRYGAIAFSIGSYGYVGTGYDDNYLKDIYRFDPTAESGHQWEIVNGYGGEKRIYGNVFVIDDVAYICCGENNGGYPGDFWKFDGTTWTRLRDIQDDGDSDTTYDDDTNDDYSIVRKHAVAFVIDGKGYITTGTSGSLRTDYWVYDPSVDLWYGDSDDDFTAFKGTSREFAVSFSTGTRGFVLTGTNGLYFEDMWELLPYEKQDTN